MPTAKTQKRRTQKRRTRRGGTGKGQSTRYNIVVPQGSTRDELDKKYPITGPSTVVPVEGVKKSSPKSKFSATRWFRSRNDSRKVTPM